MVGTADGSARDAGRSVDGAVTLAVVGPELREQVVPLAPHPSQRRWSGVAADTLWPAERDPAQWPVAILLDGRPVGFFVLHGGTGAGHLVRPSGELLIRAFFVDAAFQGRGIGRQALAALPAFARSIDPALARLVLTVNVENVHAQRAYTRAGFVDTGVRYQRGGRPQLVLELRL